MINSPLPTIRATDILTETEIKDEDNRFCYFSIYPALHTAFNKDARINPIRGQKTNLVMHRDAVAIAMRPLMSGGAYTGTEGQMSSLIRKQACQCALKLRKNKLTVGIRCAVGSRLSP